MCASGVRRLVLLPVVDDRMAVADRGLGDALHVLGRDLAAIPLRAARLHGHGSEQAGVDGAAVAFAAGRRGRAVHQVGAFPLGVDGVGRGVVRLHQAAPVHSDVRAVGGDVVDELHAHDVDRGRSRRRLLIVDRILGQEVLEVDAQAVSDVHAQDERPRALVVAQPDVAGDVPLGRIDRNDVAAERVHHPLRLDRAEAVPEEDLIEGDDVGPDPAHAVHGLDDLRVECGGGEQHRGGGEEPGQGAELAVHTLHDRLADVDAHRTLRRGARHKCAGQDRTTSEERWSSYA